MKGNGEADVDLGLSAGRISIGEVSVALYRGGRRSRHGGGDSASDGEQRPQASRSHDEGGGNGEPLLVEEGDKGRNPSFGLK